MDEGVPPVKTAPEKRRLRLIDPFLAEAYFVVLGWSAIMFIISMLPVGDLEEFLDGGSGDEGNYLDGAEVSFDGGYTDVPTDVPNIDAEAEPAVEARAPRSSAAPDPFAVKDPTKPAEEAPVPDAVPGAEQDGEDEEDEEAVVAGGAPPPAGGGAGGGGKKKKKCLPDDARINPTGPASFEVDRELIEFYASHMNQAMKLAATYWHKDGEGDVDGFIVKHMRCGSPLHQAGLRNNDVIHAVNNKEVTTIAQALGAFRKVKRKDVLKVDITRKGQKMRLRYDVT
jgi:hypothetical protein